MTTTTNYTAGEIVLATIPFSSGGTTVRRPALVVMDTGDNDLLVARVTTQSHATAWDVPVADWKGAGLLAPSVIRLNKLTVIEKSLVHKRIGTLRPADHQAIATVLQLSFENW